MKRFALAVLAPLTLAAPAFAGGLATPAPEPVVTAPVPVAPVRADGNWGGAYAGAHLGYADVNDPNADGAFGGAQLGYRWDLGTTVLGVEADVSGTNIKPSTGGGKVDTLAHLKLQAGYDFGRTLVYATAGAAYAKGDIGGTNTSDTGYFGGIGVDYQVNDQWTVGGEVLAHRFDNFDGTGLDPDATTAALRVNYRF
ncbi:outer membrane protein [Gemmobacter sp. LW-1]|uniref:outer membrane protein n=1 Tax=Gemmobacter sp. LW-1 TaxID=1529005 RepID=UPI0006C75000|nr:outer membrane beta-barrel protein [Gemmobacter sp. LW-1]